jgi:hypothetical protein
MLNAISVKVHKKREVCNPLIFCDSPMCWHSKILPQHGHHFLCKAWHFGIVLYSDNQSQDMCVSLQMTAFDLKMVILYSLAQTAS